MFINDSQTEKLTDEQWNVAHAIANNLTRDKTDVNELNKVISYLHIFIHRDNIGSDFFEYLETLENYGNEIGHSDQTHKYYEKIKRSCKKYLKKYENKPPVMLTILGWVSRLMKYYEYFQKTYQFQVADILDALVIKKSQGNFVTYEIEGIPYKEKEAKKFDLIPDNQTVKVIIKSLKEDGSINHIKFYK
ncbi:hypothetical protein [Okeania sp. KiyG1]|uniref:hypothetical protein n=1 Tax=Okeania sp. KiyG1 TaxID=2720165 RepID=UPI00192261B6|nr:hypothetical protein [Okeania sp. KiyG1]GGA44709.1 hypothetical protein CYANOKiyG1_63500 [Okeania sp. KiyG1]